MNCAAAGELAAYRIVGDAIPEPLAGRTGEAARGREIVAGRDANCLLCHAMPAAGKRFMGDLGPSLAGVASRLNAGQIRLRIVDSTRLNPETIMPSYYRVEGLERVAEPWRGKPILNAQQIEDTIAYLLTLR
jgi:sulfur-oxidizing protein SoxX